MYNAYACLRAELYLYASVCKLESIYAYVNLFPVKIGMFCGIIKIFDFIILIFIFVHFDHNVCVYIYIYIDIDSDVYVQMLVRHFVLLLSSVDTKISFGFSCVSLEGVCYAKKDFNLAKHPNIDVPNLQVIKLMQSFKSKEYVRETFAWMHYYWYLTNDGIEFLRAYLNLPSEIVPATLKKQNKPVGRPMGGPPGDRPRYFIPLLLCDYVFFLF